MGQKCSATCENLTISVVVVNDFDGFLCLKWYEKKNKKIFVILEDDTFEKLSQCTQKKVSVIRHFNSMQSSLIFKRNVFSM